LWNDWSESWFKLILSLVKRLLITFNRDVLVGNW
jgi:hypothetical protein